MTKEQKKALALIKKYEGFRSKVYLDGNGIRTIGYGFTDPALIRKGKISQTEADARLLKEVLTRLNILRDTLGHDQWDALSSDAKAAFTSYHFNYPGGFKDDTQFMKLWKAGDYTGAINQVNAGMNDPKNPGLRPRRLEEQRMLYGDPYLGGKISVLRTDGGKKMIIPLSAYGEQPKYDSTWKPEQPTKTIYPLNNTTPESISSWSGADAPNATPRLKDFLEVRQEDLNRGIDVYGDPTSPFSLRLRLPSLTSLMLLNSPLRLMELYFADALGISDILPLTPSLFPRLKDGKLPKYSNGTPTDPPIGIVDKITLAIDNATLEASTKIMEGGRSYASGAANATEGENIYSGTAQDTYLLGRDHQRKVFLDRGYIEAPGDYGLVRKAVGNRNLPVYQRHPDAISRDNLIVLGNYNYGWLGEPDYDIEHGGDYPTAIYVDHNGNFYLKAWDLNDYGPDAQGNSGVKYKLFDKYIASAIDKIGSPTVTTTGYLRIPYNNDTAPIIDKMMAARGLYPTIDGDNVYWGAKDFVLTPGDKAMWLKYMRNISEGNSYKDGKSPIHIKPANRGKFTALKKRTGHSASWFKAHGTPALKKMAIFALNAKKWRH